MPRKSRKSKNTSKSRSKSAAKSKRQAKELEERQYLYNIGRCQAYTENGTRCQRNADIRQPKFVDKIILNLSGEKVSCCSLCWQHAKIATANGIYKILENRMSWDDYCVIYPDKCIEIIQ